ncbi:MAG: amidohydrolase 2 [Actinomycetia bacterium]|nr:amidohydrolase 2 [Actinomycetes bacterium]
MREIPRIVSVDDHVIEPPHLWQTWLPARHRERGPKVVRSSYTVEWVDGQQVFRMGGDGPATDFWVYEDLLWSHQMLNACAGYDEADWWMGPIGFDQMRPGCYDPKARLADMDDNHVEASLCFPTYPRFCGQLFAERADKELALACVQAYNDWMVEEWAGDSGGRLVPLCIVPLWDPVQAAAEVRRNAARGVKAVAFSELPGKLGLPTIHDPGGAWEPLLAACDETGTAIFMHIGSGSTFLTSSTDAPPSVTASLVFMTSAMSLTDWLFSGALARYPNLRICFAEGQIGWMPYVLERADKLWAKEIWRRSGNVLPEPPSSYMRQVYGAFFDDVAGLEARNTIGVDQLVFETDYPHQDSTWPNTVATVEAFAPMLDDDELEKVVRGNASRLLGLGR